MNGVLNGFFNVLIDPKDFVTSGLIQKQSDRCKTQFHSPSVVGPWFEVFGFLFVCPRLDPLKELGRFQDVDADSWVDSEASGLA